jgi:hypothetical protein
MGRIRCIEGIFGGVFRTDDWFEYTMTPTPRELSCLSGAGHEMHFP